MRNKMMRLIWVVIPLELIGTIGIQESFAEEFQIPEWILNNSKMWSEGRVNDSNFISGIQYLVNEEIIKLPEWYFYGDRFLIQVPAWFKNNAGWWADGRISDEGYVNGIQYLLDNRIIVL